jgi:hypothetical protein
MADVIHEHTSGTTESTGGMGFVLGILLIIIFVWALFVYGIPLMRGGGGGGTTNNTTNTTIPDTGNPQINVPDKVDVNLNQGGQ